MARLTRILAVTKLGGNSLQTDFGTLDVIMKLREGRGMGESVSPWRYKILFTIARCIGMDKMK